jgi:hypothetical protein
MNALVLFAALALGQCPGGTCYRPAAPVYHAPPPVYRVAPQPYRPPTLYQYRWVYQPAPAYRPAPRYYVPACPGGTCYRH